MVNENIVERDEEDEELGTLPQNLKSRKESTNSGAPSNLSLHINKRALILHESQNKDKNFSRSKPNGL